MKHEVQIHFENCGQLAWHEDIEDVEEWLMDKLDQDTVLAFDEDTNRHFGFEMKRVNAIIVTDKSKEKPDIWSRTYAVSKGEVEENNFSQHTGNDRFGSSKAPSGGCCA
jgi:hypothetical protein